jgi:hypothetical protein
MRTKKENSPSTTIVTLKTAVSITVESEDIESLLQKECWKKLQEPNLWNREEPKLPRAE